MCGKSGVERTNLRCEEGKKGRGRFFWLLQAVAYLDMGRRHFRVGSFMKKTSFIFNKKDISIYVYDI